MSRKKKTPEKRRPEKRIEEREPSPFDNIVLKEKKEPEKKKPAPPKPVAKKPGEIVQGYIPSASFKDILESYEKTGNPYSLPKSSAHSSPSSFGDILDQWEGKKTKKKEEKAPSYSSPKYKATKSFQDILDQYEGVVRKEKKKEEKPIEKKREEIKGTTLFVEESEEDKPSAEAVWSVIGGRNPNYVRKEEEKAKDKERETPSYSRSTPKYSPSKSFSEILSDYEGVKQKSLKKEEKEEKEEKTEKKETRKEEEFTPPPEPNFFLEKDEDIPISSSVVWSVMGGANENFVREEKKEEKAPVIEEKKPVIEDKKEVKEEREKSSYTPTKDFSEILSSFSEKERRRREEDTVEAPSPAVFFQEPENDSFFLEENEDNKVSSDVVWSIVGGANKDYVRKETEEKKEEEKEETEQRRVSKPFEPKHSFSTVLSSYEKKKDKVPEKTFEEILKEKGDGKVKRRTFTFTELKRMDPQATLDLHGETQKDSEVKVREFLSSSLSNGLRKISIITGRGLHSEDGQGVLREVAEGVLRESDAVSDISNAPLSKGGSGALWVVLKEKKD